MVAVDETETGRPRIYTPSDEGTTSFLAGRFSRRMIVVGGALGVVALAVLATLMMASFRDRQVAGIDPAQAPLIKADERPFKAHPEDPGGMDVPNRDKFVYRRIKGDVEPPSVEKLLAEPEEPLPPPQPASPAVLPAEAAAPVGTAAAEAPASEGTASPPAEIGAASASTDAPGDAPSDAALPADGAVATAMVIPAPRERPGQAKAAAATAAPSQPVKPTSPVPPAASAAQPARQPSPVAAAAPARSVAANGGRYRVQIGSVASPDQAKSEWQRLRSRHGDLLASLQAEFVRADLGNRGVVYRVRVGPLQGEEKARSLCRSLAGRNVGCMVVAPSG